MDISFSEEQECLRSTARDVLERECSMASVRELLDDPRGYRTDLWSRMAELGWHGLLIPEAYGGAGLGLVELVVVLEEMGRALVPAPFLANLQGTLAVLFSSDEELKQRLLPEVAAGERILSLAITEEPGDEDLESLETRSAHDADACRISGTKLFVPDGQNADTLIVVTRSGGARNARTSLACVERNAPGLLVLPLDSIDRTRRLAEVRFDDTPATPLGSEGEGDAIWPRVRDHALVALGAESLGAMRRVLDDCVRYATERKQFGRPIGANQAVQHQCADMLIDIEASQSLVYYAAWAIASGADDAAQAAAMAKAWTGEAFRRLTSSAVQIHGGVGFTWEYDCHLFLKRARANESTYGSPARHRERVARRMGL